MKFKLFNVALCLALSATVMSASAQKKISSGVAVYSVSTAMGSAESKVTFTADSSAAFTDFGIYNMNILSDTKNDYLVICVDVPIRNQKKAAVASPSELEGMADMLPKLAFTPTTETKTIAGYNCTKVKVKETKSNKDYEAWVTNDISVPLNGLSRFFEGAGGVPVQFVTFQQGQEVKVTLKSITEKPVAKGAFSIPAGFDKVTLADLSAMRGG